VIKHLKHTREEAQAVRNMLLNDINRKINTQLKVDKNLLSRLGRCYYIVKIHGPKNIQVIVVGAEAPLSAKRNVLCNKQLYTQHSYFGRIEFRNDKCWFTREGKIKDTTTYAEGQVLMTFKLDPRFLNFTSETIRAAFMYYKGDKK